MLTNLLKRGFGGRCTHPHGGSNELKFFKVCLTGGPCSGKTTCQEFLRKQFEPQYRIWTVPEVATMTVQSGINIVPSGFTEEHHKKFTV